MLQVFSDLENLANTHFYIEPQFQLANFKTFLVDEKLKTSDEVIYLQESAVRMIYYNEIFGRAHNKVVEYIDNTAGIKSKEQLSLFIETVFIKIGNLRKTFRFNYNLFINLVKDKPESQKNLTDFYIVYMSLDMRLNDLFDKVKSTYGHLLHQKTLKQFEDRLPLAQDISDLLRKPFDDDYDNDIKRMREVAYSKPTWQDAVAWLLAEKTAKKQVQIKYPYSSEGNVMDLPDYTQRLLVWIDLEIEHLKEWNEVYASTGLSVQKPATMSKVKTDLTVAQLAFLFDMCQKEKIIIGSQTDIEAFVVANFGSKRTADISKDSLHNKVSEVSEKEIENLKDKLMLIVKAINTKQNKDKKK